MKRFEMFQILECLIVLGMGNWSFSQQPEPIKIVVLAGQSNMEGQAVVHLSGTGYNQGKGTLLLLTN